MLHKFESLVIKSKFNQITTAKQIKKELIKHAILYDPLVDENFYCRKLNKLSINNSEIEILYNNVGKDIYSLMALIRGQQIGIINKKFIYDIISISRSTDLKWLIKLVKIKIHKLLGLDKIKIMCHDNPGLYELAVRKRINGFSYDETCYFVQSHLIDINKE
jgi:hypothetical protein